MNILERFLDWAGENQWKLEKKKENSDRVNLPGELIQRYGEIPGDYGIFLKSVKSLSDKGRNAWFLCEDDFSSDTPAYACRWNEPELISLDAAQGDGALVDDIRRWWDRRLPVALARDGKGYKYYALDLDSGGTVVRGRQPQFEDTEKVAASFSDFLEKIMRGETGL